MSKITNTRDMAWYPPQFPAQGRLPTQAYLVGKNCHQQDSQERAYRQELCLAADRRVEPPCCKALHFSLFFDGTVSPSSFTLPRCWLRARTPVTDECQLLGMPALAA